MKKTPGWWEIERNTVTLIFSPKNLRCDVCLFPGKNLHIWFAPFSAGFPSVFLFVEGVTDWTLKLMESLDNENLFQGEFYPPMGAAVKFKKLNKLREEVKHRPFNIQKVTTVS